MIRGLRRRADRAAQLATTNATDIAVNRAILLFQTGKKEEGLARARQALATAQSEADKSEANTCIRAMEVRLAMDKASQTNNPSTNGPSLEITVRRITRRDCVQRPLTNGFRCGS